MSVRSVLSAIAEAIRVKTGESGTMKLEQMPAKIAGIQTGGNIQSARTVTVTANGTQEIVPDEGYEGIEKATVTVNVQPPLQENRTISPAKDAIFVAPAAGYYGLASVSVLGDGNLLAENIKKGVTIFGVTGTYEGYDAESLTDAATAADVLEGKEIMLPDGTVAAGTYQTPQTASTEAADATIAYEYDPDTDTLTIVQTPPLTD